MILLQTVSIDSDSSGAIRQWIEVGAIVISPVITILIWQLNIRSKRKHDKLNNMARFSSLLYKFIITFKETETQEIRYQTALNIDKEKFKDDLKHLRLSINKMNKERLNIKTEIHELFNKIKYYCHNCLPALADG